jgi:pimeloyl-ACP methyl ester carboxylesterase
MSAPSLLLLPGLLCDARLWAAQVAGLGQTASCTVVDLTAGETVEALARATIAQAPPGPFALAGLSMGGYVALEIVRQVPARVKGLALLDTNARPDAPESTADRRRMMALAETDFDRVVSALVPRLLSDVHRLDQGMVDTVRAMARSIGKAAYRRQQHAIIARPDSRPHLARIACPTLVLCGAEDVLTPPALHEEMAAAIPGAELAIAPGSGHLSPLEAPRFVTDALSGWLARLSP